MCSEVTLHRRQTSLFTASMRTQRSPRLPCMSIHVRTYVQHVRTYHRPVGYCDARRYCTVLCCAVRCSITLESQCLAAYVSRCSDNVDCRCEGRAIFHSHLRPGRRGEKGKPPASNLIPSFRSRAVPRSFATGVRLASPTSVVSCRHGGHWSIPD